MVILATYQLPEPFGRFIRCLAMLEQRRTETATMRWSHIVGDEWHLPRETTKQDRAHIVPLSAEILADLNCLARYGKDAFVFTTTDGVRPISGFSKMKTEFDQGWPA